MKPGGPGGPGSPGRPSSPGIPSLPASPCTLSRYLARPRPAHLVPLQPRPAPRPRLAPLPALPLGPRGARTARLAPGPRGSGEAGLAGEPHLQQEVRGHTGTMAQLTWPRSPLGNTSASPMTTPSTRLSLQPHCAPPPSTTWAWVRPCCVPVTRVGPGGPGGPWGPAGPRMDLPGGPYTRRGHGISHC